MSVIGGSSFVTNGLVLLLDPRVTRCYSPGGTSFINLITNTNYATLNTNSVSYTTTFAGSLSCKTAVGFSGTWAGLGLTNSFTITYLMKVFNFSGFYQSATNMCESYLTRGFRFGFDFPTGRRLQFWSNESGGTFGIKTPDVLFQMGEPMVISYSFDPVLGLARVYKNGMEVARSNTGTTLISPTTESLGFNNGLLNNTFTSLEIGNIMIHNRPLSIDEHLQNYFSLKGRFDLL